MFVRRRTGFCPWSASKKTPERPPAAVTWANRRQGHDENDKPTGEVLGTDVNVNVQFNNDGNADFSDNTNENPNSKLSATA